MATSTIAATGVALTGLVTAAEYNTFANLSSPSNSTQIQAAIYDATEYIFQRVDRWLVSEADAITIVEMFSGQGAKAYFPRQGDVISLGIIELWNGENWETIDDTMYEPETDGNQIFFRNGYVFSKGTKNWRITYTFGLKGGIPRNLKRACCELARYYVSQKNDQSLKSETDGEQSFSYYQNVQFPDDETTVLGGRLTENMGQGSVPAVLDSFKRYYSLG